MVLYTVSKHTHVRFVQLIDGMRADLSGLTWLIFLNFSQMGLLAQSNEAIKKKQIYWHNADKDP